MKRIREFLFGLLVYVTGMNEMRRAVEQLASNRHERDRRWDIVLMARLAKIASRRELSEELYLEAIELYSDSFNNPHYLSAIRIANEMSNQEIAQEMVKRWIQDVRGADGDGDANVERLARHIHDKKARMLILKTWLIMKTEKGPRVKAAHVLL